MESKGFEEVEKCSGRMWDKGGKSERAEREQGELTRLFAYLDVPVAEMEIADIFHLFCVFPL